MKRFSVITIAAAALLVASASCNRLTKEAKAMVGDYYISEISQDVPLLSLKGNGKCVISAVKTDVLTYHVEGKWNVKNDSLIIDLDPEKVTFEGDSSLIADIPAHSSFYIVKFDDINLEVQKDGLNYSYHRRVEAND